MFYTKGTLCVFFFIILLIVAGMQDRRRRGSQGAEASVGRANGKAKMRQEWSKHLSILMYLLVAIVL